MVRKAPGLSAMTNSYVQVRPCYGAMLTGNGRAVQPRVFVQWGYAPLCGPGRLITFRWLNSGNSGMENYVY